MPPNSPYGAPLGARVPLDFGGNDGLIVLGDVAAGAPPDAVSLSFASRQQANYSSGRSATFGLFDPALNTFATWTPPPAVSRNVPDYSSPRSQAINAFTPTVVPDTASLGATSRSVAFYKSPPPQIQNVFDPAANSFRDWAPQPAASRQVPFYKGSYSAVFGAADEIIADVYAYVIQSRQQANYSPPRSQAINVLSGASAPIPDTDAFVAQSRRDPRMYNGGPSQVINAMGLPPDVFAFIAQSRRDPRLYNGGPSQVINALLSAVAVPDTQAFIAQSRPVAFYSPVSRDIIVALVTPQADAYAPPVAQSRAVADYRAPLSIVTTPFFVPPAPDVVALSPVMSRPFLGLVARVSRVFVPELGTTVVVIQTGGGGFGADMLGRFTDRYDDRYDDRYQDRYQETFRRQR